MIRVFPRRTRATPTDDLAFWPGKDCRVMPSRALPVLVSVAFTQDVARAERIADGWRQAGYSVTVGGPAYDDPGGEFEPGRFLAPGYVITSRGCPNRCDFCFVPKREGGLRELEIKPGIDVLDNNLLACSDRHVAAVFAMLRDQRRCVRFTGGLEAARVTPRVLDLLRSVKLPQSKAALFLAYDDVRQARTVQLAAERLRAAGMRRRQLGCYVLVGRNGDSPDAALGRLEDVLSWGLLPFAMFYRDDEGRKARGDWRKIQRAWTRQAAIYATHPNLD